MFVCHALCRRIKYEHFFEKSSPSLSLSLCEIHLISNVKGARKMQRDNKRAKLFDVDESGEDSSADVLYVEIIVHRVKSNRGTNCSIIERVVLALNATIRLAAHLTLASNAGSNDGASPIGLGPFIPAGTRSFSHLTHSTVRHSLSSSDISFYGIWWRIDASSIDARKERKVNEKKKNKKNMEKKESRKLGTQPPDVNRSCSRTAPIGPLIFGAEGRIAPLSSPSPLLSLYIGNCAVFIPRKVCARSLDVPR